MSDTGQIFVGQTKLDINLDFETDITGYQTVLVKYIKPDGTTTGSFTATVDDAALGLASYTVTSATDIDVPGDWVFWGHITYTDNTVIAGEPQIVNVKVEGDT